MPLRTRENPESGIIEVLVNNEWVDFDSYRKKQIDDAYQNSVQFLRERLGEDLDGDVGEQGHRLGDFGEARQTGQVAHQHVADDPCAQPAQHRLEDVFVDVFGAQEIPQGGGVEGLVDAGGEARREPAAAVELAAQEARAGEGGHDGLGQGRDLIVGLFGHGRSRLVEWAIVYVRPELCLPD